MSTRSPKDMSAAIDSIIAEAQQTVSREQAAQQAYKKHDNQDLSSFIDFSASRKHSGALIAGLTLFGLIIVGVWGTLLWQSIQNTNIRTGEEIALFEQSTRSLDTLLEQTTFTPPSEPEAPIAIEPTDTNSSTDNLKAVLGSLIKPTTTPSSTTTTTLTTTTLTTTTE